MRSGPRAPKSISGSVTLFNHKLIRTSYTAKDIVWGARFAHLQVEECETYMTANYKPATLNKYTMVDFKSLSVRPGGGTLQIIYYLCTCK